MGGRSRRHFSVGDRSWLDLSVGDQILLSFVSGSRMTWFRFWIKIHLVFVSGGVQNRLVFRARNENDLTSGLVSWLTWFCVGHRSWLHLSVRAEIDMFFVRCSKSTLFLVRCSKSTLFLYAGLKLLVWCVSIEIDLIVVTVVEIDFISVWGIELDSIWV